MPTLDMRDLAKMFRKLPEQVRKDVDMGVRLAAQRGRTHLVKKTPVDTGQARVSWKVTDTTIHNDAPHIGILERGARPHKVSPEGIEALTRWALRTLSVKPKARGKREDTKKKKTVKKGKKTPGKKKAPRKRESLTETQARSVAWAIAKKLEREGQPGKFFVEKSLPQIKKFLQLEIESQLRKRVR